MTSDEELYEFIDGLDTELAKPALHAVVDALPEPLIHQLLHRVRSLEARSGLNASQLLDNSGGKIARPARSARMR